jgi:hypothetical protein
MTSSDTESPIPPGQDQFEGVNNLERYRREGKNIGGDGLKNPDEVEDEEEREYVVTDADKTQDDESTP